MLKIQAKSKKTRTVNKQTKQTNKAATTAKKDKKERKKEKRVIIKSGAPYIQHVRKVSKKLANVFLTKRNNVV